MQGPMPDHVYNYMPDGTGLCSIADIPINFEESDGAVSSVSLNALISTFTVEGFNLNFTKEHHFASVIHLPVQVENDFDGTFKIKMILDDRMDNWWTLYRYGRTLMAPADGHPQPDNRARPFRQGAYAQRRATIPYIEVRMGDGSLEMLNVFKFKRCYLKSLGSLPQNFGSQSMVTFDAIFTYDNIDMIRVEQDPSLPVSVGQ